MGSAVVEPLPGFPAPPDRAQRADIVAQPRRRRAPRDPKAALIVTFHLAAETQDKAAVRVCVQIPGLARDHGRTARKGHGDRGRQLDPAGGERGEGERRERVVAELDRRQRVEPSGLGGGGKRPGLAPLPRRQRREDAHQRDRAAAATRAMANTIKSAKANVPSHHSCQMP